MCESNAFIKNGDEEELLLNEVCKLEPIEGGYRLTGLFGDELEVQGKLLVFDLLKHKMVFSKDA